MTFRFDLKAAAEASEIRFTGASGAAPFERWALEAPRGLLAGVDLAQRLVAADSAIEVEDTLLANASAIAGMTGAEAASLGLPPLADAVARLAARGLVTRPDYAVALEWARPTGQAILGAKRVGPWLTYGGELHRLPDVLYGIAEAVDYLNRVGDKTEDC
jgi:hypothetical protein